MALSIRENGPHRVWEISESIADLAYLTHNFYRYYGKFPSALARYLIQEFANPGETILDNYAGSGTTLVEAKLAGYNSIGIDVNPLALLACRVKTRIYDLSELVEGWHELRRHYQSSGEGDLALFGSVLEPAFPRAPIASNPSQGLHLDKWFTAGVQQDLARLKYAILRLPNNECREFFTLAFCAIIRRVSRAYDGEIRPHINRQKPQRDVWRAYEKKVSDMLMREAQWVRRARSDVWVLTSLADNRQPDGYVSIRSHNIGMIVAHPPYLNSFDYFPAYSLELHWSSGFPEIWQDHSIGAVRQLETRAWPATDQRVYEGYFQSQRLMLRQAHDVLRPGGVCCFVIGDATIKGELVPVHLMCADIACDEGFVLEEIIYRTTHYGVGKYAYSHRADYHGSAEKKDGVLILRKAI